MRPTNIELEERLRAELAEDLDGVFERLVLAYQDRLYAFALRLMGNPADAEETAQDAFVRAYRALQDFPRERVRALALKPWLYRITLNLCRNRLRARRPRVLSLDQARAGEDGGSLDPPDERERRPEALLELAEERDRLAALVAALPERYRAAVVLRFVQGLSYREVAEVLEQPIGTAKANVHRGIRTLRARLTEHEPPDHDAWRQTDGGERSTTPRRGAKAGA